MPKLLAVSHLASRSSGFRGMVKQEEEETELSGNPAQMEAL